MVPGSLRMSVSNDHGVGLRNMRFGLSRLALQKAKL